MRYEILVNVQPDLNRRARAYMDGYGEGDPLVFTYSGDQGSRGDPQVALERIYSRHNRDDRPDGQLGPSLSCGDVVKLGERYFAVMSTGFFEIPEPSKIIRHRTWREIMDERRRIREM